MICTVCGIEEATIHLTEIINTKMIEIHLCERCAQEKGTDFKTHFDFGELLGSLTDLDNLTSLGSKIAPKKCSACGLSYEQFAKSGRLGCAQCYTVFAKLLKPLIKRVQRSDLHCGKRPEGFLKLKGSVQSLNQLRARLRKYVESEEFESAAKLRDEIKMLESKAVKKSKKKNEER